jgi:hypothetical protein
MLGAPSFWRRWRAAESWTTALPAKLEGPSATNEARCNLATLSLKFRQFVGVHLRRKFAQLLAYIECLSRGSKQRVRFAQVTMNTHTCHIHSRKIELRVGIPAIGSPNPQFDRLLEIPTATLALNKQRPEPSTRGRTPDSSPASSHPPGNLLETSLRRDLPASRLVSPERWFCSPQQRAPSTSRPPPPSRIHLE